MKVLFGILGAAALSGWTGWRISQIRCPCIQWYEALLGLGHHSSRVHKPERTPPIYLKVLTSAQWDFRSNDRDRNGKNDFWRGDIAGLYALTPKEGEPPIKLIELGMAAADAAPQTPIANFAVRGPKSAYWYRALFHTDEKEPSPVRFAACAYPDTPAAGQWTYIVDENNMIYRRKGIVKLSVFPTDDELRQFWTKHD